MVHASMFDVNRSSNIIKLLHDSDSALHVQRNAYQVWLKLLLTMIHNIIKTTVKYPHKSVTVQADYNQKVR